MSPNFASFYRFFVICTVNIFLIIIYGYNAVVGESEMETGRIVPDVIDKAPNGTLNISYSGSLKVTYGNELTPTDVKDPPKVKWSAENDEFYVLSMTDPDVPCAKDPKNREFQHWLVANIPMCKIFKGEVLTEYVGAIPGKRTGLHRYVFLVFKQPDKIKFDEKKLSNTTSKGRAKFSTKEFVKKYKLGDPIAGNYFQAHWDSTVATIQKQFTDSQ